MVPSRSRVVGTVAVVLGVAAVLTLIRWASSFPTFRLFFGWPQGGTWSNTIAAIEDTSLAALGVWLFRDRIGKRLAAWWHKHHAEHTDHQFDDHLGQFWDRLEAKLDEHHEETKRAISGN